MRRTNQILHISRDNKFLDFAIHCFEQVCPGQNDYLILQNEKNPKPITQIKHDAIHSISLSRAIKQCADKDFLSQYQAMIFHGLSPTELKVLHSVNGSIKVIWFGYGFDYYPLIDYYMQRYLGKKTIKYWYNNKKGLIKFGLKVNEYLPILSFLKSKSQIKNFERVDYFAPVLEKEYLEIKSRHPEFRAKYIDWNYELGNEIFKSIGSEYVTGTNFLVGNSASITNNHLDCFELLTPKRLKKNKVLVPLSYGFPVHFKEIIKEEGSRRFQSQFEPLEEFIPFEEYLRKLRTCGFGLFGSKRQQALGNIYMGLALGIKIYLHPKNPILEELKKKGFHLYDFNDFKKEKHFDRPLSLDFQMENRELMRQMSLKENYLKKTKDLVKLIDTFE
ncbi:TDP-N-acetylfucosamine:lipid II N-acetylfucosaminyltransferase [Algoriphagus sp.]|uniref:TDP-N-acetylfucosamine:lipid II N-acetylfucosaminyltransferase n=1 Tax=Algoriphagus sp. TaxID=1872435 RepID=UPI0026047DAF|nr:TDP-N-acetylfucosamine:lipid II N-acetylfucosaminyltransferase [Algoriphagus sp.]